MLYILGYPRIYIADDVTTNPTTIMRDVVVYLYFRPTSTFDFSYQLCKSSCSGYSKKLRVSPVCLIRGTMGGCK